MYKLRDRVKALTTTEGTQDIVLGPSPDGFQSFQSVYAEGEEFLYNINHVEEDEWEVGVGALDSGGLLVRKQVQDGSNGTNKVSFSAGYKEVFVTASAAFLQTRASFGDPTSFGRLASCVSFHQDFGYNNAPLDPRLTFSRPSKAWGWRNGVLVEYDVNEPVFEDGGLRLEPQATNYINHSTDLTPYQRSTEEWAFEGGATAIYSESGLSSPRQILNVSDSNERTVQVLIKINPNYDGLWDGTLGGGGNKGVGLGTNDDMVLRALIKPFRDGTYEPYFGSGLLKTLHTAQNLGDGWYLHRLSAAPRSPEEPVPKVLAIRFPGMDVATSEPALWIRHIQVEDGFTPTSLIPTHGQPATRAADQFQWTGASFERAFNPTQGAFIFKIGEKSGLPWLGNTRPYYGAALWTEDGTTATGNPGGGVFFRSSSNTSGQWAGLAVKPPHGTSVGNRIEYNIYPNDTVGLAWQGETISLFVNGTLAGSFTHPDVVGALQAVKRFHIPDAQHMYLERTTMFATRPTDAEMEALTHA